MRLNSAALIVVTAAVSRPIVEARSCDVDLTIQTTGGIVHGTVDSATPAVRKFLGIPYAKPPVNDLRFAPPEPAPPFGELDATELPPSCMQYALTSPMVTTNEVLEFNLGGLNGTTGPISEDCLTLSIWAPRGGRKTKKALPVLIFFYGGAFFGGGTDVPYQLPSQWIQRTQGHIVVSFNHRDNIFGFPNAAGLPLENQNVGLLDQRLAIEWVRDNIAAFGGDPERIGLWGMSSGAISIAYYGYTYIDDPIANSIIMDSGNEFIDILTVDPIHGNFTFVASQFGCGELSPVEELSCMRKVDAFAIEEFMKTYYDAGETPSITFSPIVDNRTVFENYSTRAQAGRIARLPALIGSNAQDGVTFVEYNPDGVDVALADQMTMFYFFCPTHEAAKTRIAAYTGPVYRYLYAGNFTNISPRGWMGAWHGAELPLLFGTHAQYRGDSTPLEYATSQAMQDAWVRFVATAGVEMTVEGWGGGNVVEFGNEVAAMVVDTTEMEDSCSGLQLG
ncbi:related to triacylglycerol lipase V precursor [Cephalotrichum gorgonifer]|uniref:Carboxylic ester hydrolase n=1 Tax=Cephalotrichum gorgonifer TaxID=2041049 RepID=A0AAE8SZI0_9PEZI|nr:related to triacylglycerol lipase V precursor [Cephalotrichum gorgonifer]